MPTYRVYGEKIKTYYTDINAANPNSAYDIANDKPTKDWFEVENDDVIEVTDVYQNDS